MAVNSETEINLKTLQRVDSNIVEIIDNASQVALYKYETKLNKWECTDFEGTLFLYKRSLYPYHGFIIVNRMSTTNFVEPITSDMEFFQEEPYLLYKKSCGEIIGSWFYERTDFRRITNKIQSIVLKQTSPPRRQRRSSDGESQLKNNNGVQDIMSMLSEAHTEYIKTETKETVPNRNTDFNVMNFWNDKKMRNKSVKPSANKSRSPRMKKSSSSDEKCPMSPRRRFLSTGSCDSSRLLPLASNKILNELVNLSNCTTANSELRVGQQCLNGVQLLPLAVNIENLPASKRLSPLFSCDEISPPAISDINIVDQSTVPIKGGSNQPVPNVAFPNMTQPKTILNKASTKDNMNKNRIMQSSCLKDTLLSHFKGGSDVLSKVHDAYAASLKSAFTPKKT